MPETAIEKHSGQWIRQRMDLNRSARFGLEQATPEQLNVIYVLARRWKLDPVTDLTIMHGRPWVTIDGHLRRMREHPEFRGLERRPLSTEEKTAGGWNADDIVWRTDLKTARWGVITEWGKVTQAEIAEAQTAAKGSGKRTAPIGLHWVEIAQKRSLARANRLAFGMDQPDEEEIEREVAEAIAQRSDTVRITEAAAAYDRIFKDDDALPPPVEDSSAPAGVVLEGEEEPATGSAAEVGPPDPWADNRRLSRTAEMLGLKPQILRNSTPVEQVEAYNAELIRQIEGRRAASV